MSLIELFLLAIGLSMDAFTVSICVGFILPKVDIKKGLIVGLYFGVFQAVMPLIGYMAASLFADTITSLDHWITFVLLVFLGGKMVIGSFVRGDDCNKELGSFDKCGNSDSEEKCFDKANNSDKCGNCDGEEECFDKANNSDKCSPPVPCRTKHKPSVRPSYMLPLALATSIDALAVGVSFAFLRVNIIPAASFIGTTTLVISLAGVKIGAANGARLKSKAEMVGGIILILIGLKILLEHLNLLPWNLSH